MLLLPRKNGQTSSLFEEVRVFKASVSKSDCWGPAQIGDRQPRTIPTKDLLHQVVFLGGWRANFRNLRKRQNKHHPQFALAMLIVNFVGVLGGFRGPTKVTQK